MNSLSQSKGSDKMNLKKETRFCFLPRCGKSFNPTTFWHKYCSKKHKNEGWLLNQATRIILENKKKSI